MESTYDLDEIAIWNYFYDQRSYYDNITYVSSDNSTWTKIINDANIQSSNGRRINAYNDTLNGYIQDELSLWYDGYANSGTNHASVLSTWKDLSGSGYNGTLSSGKWYLDNLHLPNLAVNSNIAASTLLPAGSDRTLSITIKINSVPYTNTTYGNTGVLLGAAYYDGMGIDWYKEPTAASSAFNIKGFTRTDTETGAYFYDFSYPTKILNLTYVNNPSNGKVISYLNGIKVEESSSIYGSYTYATNMGNVGINKAQISGGNYTTSSADINVYSAKIYKKALTDEEVMHNYLYEKQKLDLE